MRHLYFILIATAAVLASCGTVKNAGNTAPTAQTTTQPATPASAWNSIMGNIGDWTALQTGGNMKLTADSRSFSSGVQVRMLRDQAVFISIRPLLGIEVGKIIITADSVYALDKVHKRYIAEKVSLLTSGIPVTVSTVQDIFLGRPFIIGKGTLCNDDKQAVTESSKDGKTVIAPNEHYKGYGYSFSFDKTNSLVSLNIVADGSANAAYQVNYGDVKKTAAGNIAHDIKAAGTFEKKKFSLALDYKNIDWNGNVKIDRSIPDNYKRMSAKDLFSMFGN